MPDGWNWDFGFATTPLPPLPPKYIAPTAKRPELLVDQYRVMLADPENNLIGLDPSPPLAATVYAERAQTRNI